MIDLGFAEERTDSETNRKPWGIAAVLLALVPFAVWLAPMTQNNQVSTLTTWHRTHTLTFQVQGSAELVRAQFEDATGTHAAQVNTSIAVDGLKWAVIAVSGTDIGCSVEVDGITKAAEGSVTDGSIDICSILGE